MHTLTLPPHAAAELLATTHGIAADFELAPLGSEVASTFLAHAAGLRYAVKMQASGPEEFELQRWRAEVAAHLRAHGHPVPRLLPAGATGEPIALARHEGRPVAVTVSEWVDALPYNELARASAGDPTVAPDPAAPDSAAQDVAAQDVAAFDAVAFGRSLGALAARMQADLTTAPRPPRPVSHTWVSHTTATTIADHLPRVADERILEMARIALDLHEREVAPVETELPRALVHQDLHDSNVLAHPDGTVAAIIDFDDMLVGWRIAEPAIAAAYLSRHAADPAAAVAAVAAGWESELPFTEAERRAFPVVVLARLALNASVWHVRMAEDRADYAQMRQAGSVEAFYALTR
ncbi:MAG: phosphotransferase enzyme family protein [Leucobacter sp.]